MPTEKAKPILRLPPKALFLEYESASPNGRGRWFARAPAEHTVEDVLSPDYFGMHQSEIGGLRPGDLVEIEPEHALWQITARVMALVPDLQRVKLREVPGTRHSFAVKPPQGYSFEWKGGRARWAILRGEIEADAGFDSQDEALARIEEMQREKAA